MCYCKKDALYFKDVQITRKDMKNGIIKKMRIHQI